MKPFYTFPKTIDLILDVVVFVFYYAVGLGCLWLFYHLHFSEEVHDYLHKIDSHDTSMGFKLYVIYGFGKLVTLILGVLFPVLLTIKAVRVFLKWRERKGGIKRI
ncbi:MAG: hypothetical protein JJU02_10005 [Cryomorphaceae bacterium]|nr:hypothetical protein [Cryomorphaceae bacterium]